MAQALILAQENQVDSLDNLKEKANAVSDEYHKIKNALDEKTKRMAEITELQKHIGTYRKTRDVYTEYRKSGYAKKFYAEHEEEILRHKDAKQFFEELHLEKLPTIAELRQEYATLQADKKKLYQSHRPAREKMMEWRTAQYNIEKLFARPIRSSTDHTPEVKTDKQKYK